MKKRALLIALFLFSLIFLSCLISASELRVTLEHPFYVNNSWISASQLKIGDILRTIDGRKVIIESIEKVKVPEGIQVYNLEDSFFHNYIVSQDNLIVHNSELPPGVGAMKFGELTGLPAGKTYKLAETPTELAKAAGIVNTEQAKAYNKQLPNPSPQATATKFFGEQNAAEISTGNGGKVLLGEKCEGPGFTASVFVSSNSAKVQAKLGGTGWKELGRLSAEPAFNKGESIIETVKNTRQTYQRMLEFAATEGEAEHLVMVTNAQDAATYNKALKGKYIPANEMLNIPTINYVEINGQSVPYENYVGIIKDIKGAAQILAR